MKARIRKYLKDTRKPIYSAALVLPFFVVYHAGTILLKTTFVNGADALIVRLLSAMSVHSIFASALVLLGCFVVWQLRTRASWKIERAKLALLYGESVLFAGILYWGFGWMSVYFSRAMPAHASHRLQKWVLYCGAGIYEELVFRFVLLGAMVWLVTRFAGLKRPAAIVLAAAAASLLFAAFHYVGANSDPFTLSGFAQRSIGGLYFSCLFLVRGFGVTAAAHALYDILVGFAAT